MATTTTENVQAALKLVREVCELEPGLTDDYVLRIAGAFHILARKSTDPSVTPELKAALRLLVEYRDAKD